MSGQTGCILRTTRWPAFLRHMEARKRSPLQTTLTRRSWPFLRERRFPRETPIRGPQMGKLEGKIALITCGNGGIGLATARRVVEEGAYVFITGRREPELSAAIQDIGCNVTGVQGDVSKLGDLDRLFD